MTWDAQGKDVYYQGKTSKETPVKIGITYKLDGKNITADDLKGKTGKVTIRFDYTNKSAQAKGGKFTPFLCMTGMVLDNDQFKNVEVENGKAIDDGDRTMIGGFAMPGLADNLDLPSDADIDIPEYFQVTADVENFSLDSTFTVVTSDFFNDIDKGTIDTSKIDDALDKLQDGMTLLVDGGSKLSAGIDKLQVGSSKLQQGAADLNTGAGKVNAGASKLANGTSELQSKTAGLPASAAALDSGMAQLNAGIGSAYEGSQQLANGSDHLLKGLELFKNGNSEQTGLVDAYKGISQLKVQYDNQLLKPVNNAAKAAAKVKEEVGDISFDDQSAAELKGSVKKLKKSIAAMKDSMTEISGALEKVKSIDTNELEILASSAEATKTQAGNLSAYAGGASAALDNVLENESLTPKEKAEIEQAQQVLGKTQEFAGGISQSVDTLSAAAGKLDSAVSLAQSYDIDEILQGMQKASTVLDKQQKNVQKVVVKLDELDKALDQLDADDINKKVKEMESRFDAAVKGVNEVSEALGLLESGGTTADGKTSRGLQGAVDALGDTSNDNTLIGGAAALSAGTSQLSAGLENAQAGSAQLKAGTAQLNASAPVLAQGITTLNNGAGELAKGTKTLSNGTAQLSSGAATLTKGTVAAAKGAKTLKEGLEKYNNEGIKKLVDTYNSEFAGLTVSIDELIQAGKDYNSFSGITDGTEGHVKFIYETDSIDSGK